MFSPSILQKLKVAVQIGGQRTCSALSILFKQPMDMDVTDITIQSIDMVSVENESHDYSIALLTIVEGDINGHAALLFSKASALVVLNHLNKNQSPQYNNLSPLERSILEETANITLSSFMNSLSLHTGKKCVPSIPVYLQDINDEILPILLFESVERSQDSSMIFSAKFVCSSLELEMGLLFFPHSNALKVFSGELFYD